MVVVVVVVMVGLEMQKMDGDHERSSRVESNGSKVRGLKDRR